MEPILISACLLGVRCRYDGKSNPCPEVEELSKVYQLIPICPEQLGGLPTPREPAERQGNFVRTKGSKDVTAEFSRGAEQALYLAKRFGCTKAILKERSPSCGSKKIYDGSFSHTVIDGNGVTAELLIKNGVAVYGESEVELLLENSETQKSAI